MDQFDELLQLAQEKGLQAVDHGDGHWTVKGRYVVHFWPTSARRTIYIEGTFKKESRQNGSIEKVIQIAAGEKEVPHNSFQPGWSPKTGRKKKKSPLPVIDGGRPDLICPECGGKMYLRYSKKLDRKFYGCENFPVCKAAHGAHPDGSPLGIPADQETKKARIKAHDVFDKMWEKDRRRRGIAYVYLQKRMGLSQEECHIGRFTKDQCMKVVEICSDQQAWETFLTTSIFDYKENQNNADRNKQVDSDRSIETGTRPPVQEG